MPAEFEPTFAECERVRSRFSEYIDNTLSGRTVWEVEKHLTDCADCAAQLREMQTLAHLLQNAPRLDTGDDFMARLHARLDTVEPTAMARPSRLATLRDEMAALWKARRRYHLPALGLSVAAVALVAVLLPRTPHIAPSVPSKPVAVENSSQTKEALNQNVALTADDPLADPAAANLEAHAEMNEKTPSQDGDDSKS